MKLYNPQEIGLTKYLFFTGKGGVGKTTSACATAVNLADSGKMVILVSTDPASNLQDVFQTELTNKPKAVDQIPNLKVANFDPITAANDYKESIIGPYRGVLPDSVVENMEEQLSGSCTVEIAAFNEFAAFLTDKSVESEYDYVIFDTAPTGHTLRMLALPSAWSNYLDENDIGVSCLGQLSGLGDKKESYEQAVETLSDGKLTTLMLVTRPQRAAIQEASKASKDLSDLGIHNQKLIINGLLDSADDEISEIIYNQQRNDLDNLPQEIKDYEQLYILLRPYNVTGLDKIRVLLSEKHPEIALISSNFIDYSDISDIINNFVNTDKKIIFTMGKGGVGKTTIAIKIAQALKKRGKKVHLATTDPADHLNFYLGDTSGLSYSHIDEEKELREYKEEVLAKARETMSGDDFDYIKEDLESPCTQEIAVFRAFAEIVVIDTAPTGHTFLLLKSTQSYAKEVERTNGEVPEAIQKLLPRLQNPEETEVLMVTLPETTPVYESMRLADDLDRANIAHTWWLVNQSMVATHTNNAVLKAIASNEIKWIEKVAKLSDNKYAVEKWQPNFEK